MMTLNLAFALGKFVGIKVMLKWPKMPISRQLQSVYIQESLVAVSELICLYLILYVKL